LGFKALASTSGGFAWTIGKADFEWSVTLEETLEHLRVLSAATDLPVNADFESGYADDPEGVAANVRRCVESGVAGLSIEDHTSLKDKPLYDLSDAVARIRAARAAIDATGLPVVLTARSEAWLVRHPEAKSESIKRLVAFAEAGADVLYAPGVRSAEDIAEQVKAVAPKPVNVLVGWHGLPVQQLADLGVRRVSIGGALAKVGWSAVMAAAEEIAKEGTFTSFAGGRDVNGFFRSLS
jgi:2-methylisocitrate lyase-like PEP mutase family enzyme